MLNLRYQVLHDTSYTSHMLSAENHFASLEHTRFLLKLQLLDLVPPPVAQASYHYSSSLLSHQLYRHFTYWISRMRLVCLLSSAQSHLAHSLGLAACQRYMYFSPQSVDLLSSHAYYDYALSTQNNTNTPLNLHVAALGMYLIFMLFCYFILHFLLCVL